MCTAKLYGYSTDTALSVGTRTDTACRKVRQLTDSGYQDLQHHWLIHDRFLKTIPDTICTTTARTCQQDCQYCSLVQLSVATTIIILDVRLTMHRSSMWNKKPTRCHLGLYLFLLISCSTCFGPPCAHLQELTT